MKSAAIFPVILINLQLVDKSIFQYQYEINIWPIISHCVDILLDSRYQRSGRVTVFFITACHEAERSLFINWTCACS
ncbi:hypothetical protein C3743_38340 [Burkholderia contaminans]|uniref:Uncharacterized protein n=1 Tax=Burkholderia contaminans TaxID=488447 RepID=A0A2S5DMP8_9BURK|nr:hypothetical protein C3743_38340 [Burkholderia contaminans]